MTAVLDHPTTSTPSAAPAPPRGRLARIARGPEHDPAWSRPALLTLLSLTGLLYAWNLAASGYANSFYAAAVQAGTKSWKAWFFGSLDAGNSITVDKPPAALWVDGLSARIFGFDSWSLLVPQAVEGVLAVALLYAAVKRMSGPKAGLLAGTVLALTPAAALIFRFDNPDALLTLLLVAGGYAVVRSLEQASARWLAVAGSALGFAFLTKMLQGFLVLPGFALVYLVAAPTGLWRRIKHVLIAGGAVVVSAGWWVATVAIWPADARPYIGGSTNNSVLNLVFGYNGLGRLFGSDGNGGGGNQNAGFGGATGITRLFTGEIGNEISWLLPAALVALVAGLWVTRSAPRTDRTRAALILWGSWLIVTGLVFSYMQGTMHPYYTVALAPAVGGLVGTGALALWTRREQRDARVGLAAVTAAAAGWSYVVLDRVPTWHTELRVLTLVLGAVAVLGLLVPPARLGRLAVAVPAAAVLAGLLGTGSFALATAATAHTGSIPSVGPAVAAASAGGMGGGTGGPSGAGGGSFSGTRPTGTAPSGTRPTGSRPTGSSSSSSSSGSATSTTLPGGSSSTGGMSVGGGGVTASSALVKALQATTSTWSAATVGDQTAAELELASNTSVMAIGGWDGSDPSITLAQFKADVAAGEINYFIAGSGGGGAGAGGGTNTVAAQITAWVKAHSTATTVGGQTVYVLASS